MVAMGTTASNIDAKVFVEDESTLDDLRLLNGLSVIEEVGITISDPLPLRESIFSSFRGDFKKKEFP